MANHNIFFAPLGHHGRSPHPHDEFAFAKVWAFMVALLALVGIAVLTSMAAPWS